MLRSVGNFFAIISYANPAKTLALADGQAGAGDKYIAPLLAINIAGVSAVILRMLRQLSELYKIRFERGRMRSLVLAIVGGMVPTGIGGAAVSTVALVAPVPAFAGLAVPALTADAVTRAIGEVLIESFERDTPLY